MMGLDLTLVPDGYGMGFSHHHFLAYNRLGLDRDYSLFGQISKSAGQDRGGPQVCKPKPLPEGARFNWYGDEGLKEQSEDPYGDPLTYVLAGELAKVDAGQSSDWNKGAFAFIRALPPETIVVLWWH